MGGCRCTYRNCSLRTDGKTHMFHYPVFDKVRCHQWLTNAHKLEFLNLKVSQLKNRVVCQHHFKDDNFMNFKKDKLTFDAVPTEDGPYCDSSQINETKIEQEEAKVFCISLDDIENEYLTIVDKKANFSVKYGDFLTNCDLMDLDSLNSLNQINENNQIAVKGLCALSENPIAPKNIIPTKRPVKNVRPVVRKERGKQTTVKDTIHKGNLMVNEDNTIDISKLIQTPRTEEDGNSLNLVLNVSHVPIEFEGRKSNNIIQGNKDEAINVQLLDESRLLNDQTFEVKVLDESKFLNEQPFDVKVLNEANQLNNQPFDLKVLNQAKPSDKIADTSSMKGRKMIRIISEKKMSEPLSLSGKLEPVSPTRILTFPNKRRFYNPNPLTLNPDVPIINSNSGTSLIRTDTSKHNVIVEQSEIEPLNTVIASTDNVCTQKKSEALNIGQDELLINNSVSQTTRSHKIIKSPNKGSLKTSLLKNKIPPERVAAIKEKRKFNMKLRDIVEDCLDKLDEPKKSDFDNRKALHATKIRQSKKQVGSYLAKDSQLPSVQDYTISYLEARIKQMEDNLLNKIGENSQKIQELKQSVAPSLKKKTIHTQTSVSEYVHKRQLYQELSQYLSQEANSLIYEELFINKYSKDVPKASSPKRRKRR